ncbi:hypothetical protein CFC21_101995 [Triticum aestivum]|uniref:Amino acid transporter transmembrane domain-containing protein n=2 Tax=Triticum aestivum TaxID=4565 RepID=A0A9R1N4P6_WHEAT|nr:hypothetical protein CFC21_101995 [Triticum aestivum]
MLHLTTAWATAYLGYALASHRLRMGTERAIIDGELPQPCHHSKDRAYRISNTIPVAAFIVTVIWTASMTAIIFTNDITDEFDIVFLLSYVGWIHVAVWLLYVADVPMRKVLMKEPMVSLLASLLPCLMISPVISVVCRILSILFQCEQDSIYMHQQHLQLTCMVLGKHDKSCQEKLNSMEHMGDLDENPKKMTATSGRAPISRGGGVESEEKKHTLGTKNIKDRVFSSEHRQHQKLRPVCPGPGVDYSNSPHHNNVNRRMDAMSPR